MGQKRKRPVKDDPSEGSGKQQVSKYTPGPKTDARLASNAAGISHPVISLYYRQVVTLRQYIFQRIPRSSKARRRRIAALRSDDGVKEASNPASGQDLAGLLDTTLVGVREELSPLQSQERRRDFLAWTQTQRGSQSNTDIGPLSMQSEIVDFVITSVVNRSGASYQKTEHLLSHGFRSARGPPKGSMLPCSLIGTEATYINKNVRILKQAPWTEVLPLLGKNGDEIVCNLLFDCGIFQPADAEKRIYCQISGLPLCNLEPMRASYKTIKEGSSPPINRASISDPQSGSLTKPTKPTKAKENSNRGLNAIVFHRQRMFYARPHLNTNGRIEFGLPNHVFNRFPSSESLQRTAHILKYIFPRQFDLHNVFTVQPNSRENGLYKDYSSRETDIAKKEALRAERLQQRADATGRADKPHESAKLPKRLRGRALELVRQLQNRHKHCCYRELLRYYCPYQCTNSLTLGLSDYADNETPASGTASSGSERLVTQPAIAGQAVDNIPPGVGLPTASIQPLTREKRTPKPKVNLTDYATPAASISSFCRAVIRNLLPPDFFGVNEQGIIHWKIILRHVDRFIRLRRYENLTLDEVCRGIKITQIPWLEPHSLNSNQTLPQNKICMSDLQKRKELFHEFIYYLFDSILIPLIRGNFYVTESQINRNRLFYFRHDAWRHITAQPLANLKSSMLQELTRQHAHDLLVVSDKRKLGYGSLRLLPKTTGIRPIVNLKRNTVVADGKNKPRERKGVNFVIAPTHGMLNCEKGRGDLLGSSMNSIGDMHMKLKYFKDSLVRQGWNNTQQTPLYFVKLDIQSCFDTIPQEKLVRLIEKMIPEEAYHHMRYVEMKPNKFSGAWPAPRMTMSKIQAQRKFLYRTAPVSASEPLVDAVTNGNISGKRHSVFVDLPGQKSHKSEALLDILDEHVRYNLVKIGKRYFKQRNGIPQGSAMSSLLCNLFYAEMERDVLGFLQSEDTLLLRLVDDFLLITLDCNRAMQFLQAMIKGQPAYGISVNPAKSLVNFAASVDGIQIPRLVDTSLFPYCGNLINIQTLGILKDQDRILDGAESVTAALTDSLTVESTRVPGRTFHRKVLDSIKRAMHPMYLDTAHNSHTAVLSNLYTALVTSAMKMYRYARVLPGRAQPRSEVVVRTIRDAIELGNQLCRGRHGLCTVSHGQMRYLGAAAFRFVLGRKQTRYAGVLRWLDGMLRELRRSRAGNGALLAQVVRRGNLTYGGWRF